MFGIPTLLSVLLLAAVPSAQDATLIFVTTPGCGPCQQIAPLIQELAKEGYSVETVNAAEHPDIVQRLQVDRFPTLLMLSGDRIVDKVIGGGDPVVVRPRIIKMFDRAVELKQKQDRAESGSHTFESHLSQSQPLPATQSSFPAIQPAQSRSIPTLQRNPTAATPDAKVASAALPGTAPNTFGVPPTSNQATSLSSSGTFPGYSEQNFARGESTRAYSAQQTSTQPISGGATVSPWITSSVKLRVDAENAHSWGTGTIVDTRDGEALILTCGHIFRDSKGESLVEVHFFGQNSTAKAYGHCIFHDLEADLALVAISPPFPVRAIPIAPVRYQLQGDQPVWSVGCDGGANPTLKKHQILSQDRIRTGPQIARPFHYIQVSEAPVSGRSGGGLFTQDGYLVGVCNTGDKENNDGHFVPPHIIRQILDYQQLSVVYENPSLIDDRQGTKAASEQFTSTSPIPTNVIPTSSAQANLIPTSFPASIPTVKDASANDWTPTEYQPFAQLPASHEGLPLPTSPLTTGAPNRISSFPTGLSNAEKATQDEIKRRIQDGDEVILIVRSRRNPEIPSDIIILNGTSDQFLESLARNTHNSDGHGQYDPVILTSHDSQQRPLEQVRPLTETQTGATKEVSYPIQHFDFRGPGFR